MSRIGHTTSRHPLCPSCGYNLVATIANGGRRCPECGRDFDLAAIQRGVAADDWTPMRGLARGGGVLAIQAVIFLAVWIGVLIGLDRLTVWVLDEAGGIVTLLTLIGVVVAFAVIGLMVGSIYARGLAERLGMDGVAVTTIGAVAAAVSLVGGAYLTGAVYPLEEVGTTVAALVATGCAMVMIVKHTLLDES